MNVWYVDDGHPWDDGGWCACYWAWGKDEALELAASGYEYRYEFERSGQTAEQFFNITLVSEWPGQRCEPEHETPHEEKRDSVLRQLGWREESDYQCETCGLYPMGFCGFCEECWCCDECCECVPHLEVTPRNEAGRPEGD